MMRERLLEQLGDGSGAALDAHRLPRESAATGAERLAPAVVFEELGDRASQRHRVRVHNQRDLGVDQLRPAQRTVDRHDGAARGQRRGQRALARSGARGFRVQQDLA